MTDDKGAGEGPYRVVQPVDMIPLTVEGPTGNHGLMLQGGFLCNALNAAHTAGRKAERERCLSIIERWRPMPSEIWIAVSDEIAKGGQDGE